MDRIGLLLAVVVVLKVTGCLSTLAEGVIRNATDEAVSGEVVVSREAGDYRDTRRFSLGSQESVTMEDFSSDEGLYHVEVRLDSGREGNGSYRIGNGDRGFTVSIHPDAITVGHIVS